MKLYLIFVSLSVLFFPKRNSNYCYAFDRLSYLKFVFNLVQTFFCREDNKVSHYIINKMQQGEQTRYRIGDQMFTDLPALLNFYKVHYLDTTPLIRPATKRVEKVMGKYDFEGSVSCKLEYFIASWPLITFFIYITYLFKKIIIETLLTWSTLLWLFLEAILCYKLIVRSCYLIKTRQ
jgi:hypothetical protein